MVPRFPWRELVEGLLGEDVTKIAVRLRHHVREGLAFLGLLSLLGQPLRRGASSSDMVFRPLRGDERGINRISGF